ncbi:MAG: ATP-binding protein [Desulfonauticus sp.]|nr:ATP-binding protein [Desulfonauticus sp.]
MLIKEFRRVDFINREKEIEFFLNYFKQEPERVLWVYGPKSTGKTTLVEYIIENYLSKDKSYNIKYINFRGLLISSFDNFVESFLEEKDEEIQTELNRNYNMLGLFKLEAKTLKKIKEHKKNLFNYLLEEFRKDKRKNIFIIDEIQILQDIYINENKFLLNEFLNFCVRLTKETHLSHVLILTSNTIFLNEIYNSSKMKKTSRFKLINHLGKEDIKEWLIKKNLGFNLEEIELIYDYFGGCVSDIKKLLEEYKEYSSLKEYLDAMAEIAKNEIIFEKNNNLTNQEFELFLEIAQVILKRGNFIFDETNEEKRRKLKKVINRFCDVEILFFDPVKNTVTANSKIYIKAFEKIL